MQFYKGNVLFSAYDLHYRSYQSITKFSFRPSCSYFLWVSKEAHKYVRPSLSNAWKFYLDFHSDKLKKWTRRSKCIAMLHNDLPISHPASCEMWCFSEHWLTSRFFLKKMISVVLRKAFFSIYKKLLLWEKTQRYFWPNS